MPLFEFECSDCGDKSEILVLGSSTSFECKSCGGANLKKLLSAPSSLSGVAKPSIPEQCAPRCGASPDQVGCGGPGSCHANHMA